MGKCTKASHPTSKSARAKQPGHILHLDTVGPIAQTSIHGWKYFVLCRDEFSGFRNVGFACAKREIADIIKRWVNQTELETGNRVLSLHTDNSSEFLNQSLQGFLRNLGIAHHTSATYTPQQNGYVERDIRTVSECARTILLGSKLEKSLWRGCSNCSIHSQSMRKCKVR